MHFPRALLLLVLFTTLCAIVHTKDTKKKEKDASKKDKLKIGKKVTDYSDADIEKLLDQWDENDDDYEDEEDDKPWLKPKPKIDIQKVIRFWWFFSWQSTKEYYPELHMKLW